MKKYGFLSWVAALGLINAPATFLTKGFLCKTCLLICRNLLRHACHFGIRHSICIKQHLIWQKAKLFCDTVSFRFYVYIFLFCKFMYFLITQYFPFISCWTGIPKRDGERGKDYSALDDSFLPRVSSPMLLSQKLLRHQNFCLKRNAH